MYVCLLWCGATKRQNKRIGETAHTLLKLRWWGCFPCSVSYLDEVLGLLTLLESRLHVVGDNLDGRVGLNNPRLDGRGGGPTTLLEGEDGLFDEVEVGLLGRGSHVAVFWFGWVCVFCVGFLCEYIKRYECDVGLVD